MTPEEEIVDRLGRQLGEHFDTVQVFVTKVGEDGDTSAYLFGSGNFYAREGQVREWIQVLEQRLRNHIAKEAQE